MIHLAPNRNEAGECVDVDAVVHALVSPIHQTRAPLVLVPDETRDISLSTWLPPLVHQLKKLGALHVDVLFASGTHAPMTPQARADILGGAETLVRHHSHDCDASDLVDLGGGPLHPLVSTCDALFVLSGLTLHYLAGVGGGRKMLFPGVTSRNVATALHSTTISAHDPARPTSVELARVDDNPFHLAINHRVSTSELPPTRALFVEMAGEEIARASVGPLLEGFANAATDFVSRRQRTVDHLMDGALTVAPPPADTNLVQVHKTLLAVAAIVRPEGCIVVDAGLSQGLGNPEFASWLSRPSSSLLEDLRSTFSIGLQTAWSLRCLFEGYRVFFVRRQLSPEVERVLIDAGVVVVTEAEAALVFAHAGSKRVSVSTGGGYLLRVRPAALA